MANDFYEKLKNNSVKVNLKPDFNIEKEKLEAYKVSKKDFSGKTVFSLSDDGKDVINGELDWDEHGIGFFCGPQTSDGYISDTFSLGTAEKLEELFSDFPKIDEDDDCFSIMDIWAAENFHIINYTDGLTPKQMWKIVRTRLLRSGAKEERR